MQTITQPALSTQFVQTLVRTVAAEPYDPTGGTVSFAFTPASAFPAVQPGDGDWNPGSWITFPGPQYWAQVLIGPANGGVLLGPGRWQCWLKVTDSPEIPVLQPFVLQIV